jgi:glutamine amidotransferase
MIAVIDYGAGNVHSVVKALEAVGASVRLTRQAEEVLDAEKIVLPGVGAFGDCINSLRQLGLADAVIRAARLGRPVLGICVGMQVLFERGEEMGSHRGLGLLPGNVVRFPQDMVRRGLKIPHTGWNQVEPLRSSPLLAGLPPGFWAYFNHAYHCAAQPGDVIATADHGAPFAAVVGRAALFGLQFHPEKSQEVGLQILRNFVGLVT